MLALAASCDSVDPGEQFFNVTFVNNTPAPVVLKLCADRSCTRFDYADSIQSRHRQMESVSDRNVLTRWKLIDPDTRRVVGCIPLRFARKYDGLKVFVTQSVHCPGLRALVLAAAPR